MDDQKSVQSILFRDILDCEDSYESQQENQRSKSQQSQKQKLLRFNLNVSDKQLSQSQFTLTTTNKKYILIAANPLEKQIWLDAFRYIIPST